MQATIQQMNDDELSVIEGGDFGATMSIIGGAIALGYLAYDIYQGWSNYEASTPYVYSTITYY